jgi:hypothetical protein
MSSVRPGELTKMSEYNDRRYRLMLEQLVRFENGEIALDALVNSLEALLNVLEDVSLPWKQDFLHDWGKLEDERAYALFKNIRTFDEPTTERIRTAVAKLKLRVLEQIDDPRDRRTNLAQ